MDDATLEVRLGSVESICGRLGFSFVVKNNGNAHLQIFCSDPSNGRKSGVLLMLDEHGYEKLKEIMKKTEQTIEKLRAAGQMNKMIVTF